MKKILTLLAIIIGFFSVTGQLYATVGGPTYIYDFKYNPENESVYFTEISLSGRGCPPELLSLSLNTGQVDKVFSCSDGEKLLSDKDYDVDPVRAEIDKITRGFKSLIPINLKDNDISVDVNFVESETYSPEINEIVRSAFSGTVYQKNKKIDDIEIIGCNTKQPFTFAGYAIPGFEKKIVLLLSTKGNCFEGGYINETLHIIGGVNDLNKEYYTNYYKSASALTPDEGTLIVFEKDNIAEYKSDDRGSVTNTDDEITKQTSNSNKDSNSSSEMLETKEKTNIFSVFWSWLVNLFKYLFK